MHKRSASRYTSAILLLFVGLQISCAPKKSSGGGGSSSTPEASYCSTVQTFSSPVTITGTATFVRREIDATGLGDPGTAAPIRRAEVRALKNGSVVQCGETDNSGNFSITLPLDGSTYTIQVNSRALNTYLRTSVLKDPTSNAFYSVSTTAVPLSSGSVGTITASATSGDIAGGAFNIYEQVLRANEYIRTKVSGSFVATKSTFYWKAGVNPYTYFGGSSMVSFFSPDDNAIYILGGSGGDYNNEDTDHFDNNIILHEYGHFLEHKYSISDNPGGMHYLGDLVDPRLAWSEGFANFFGVEVDTWAAPGNTFTAGLYLDTEGNKSGSSYGVVIEYALEDQRPFAESDVGTGANFLGEGNFNEFGVTRGLWDLFDNAADSLDSDNNGTLDTTDSYQADFADFWSVFSTQFASTTLKFRNYGLFMSYFSSETSWVAGMDNIFVNERQRRDQTDYARSVSTGSTCTYTMTIPVTAGSRSNYFLMNDFYSITHAGGAFSLSMNITGGTDNLDLYLFSDAHSINHSNGDRDATFLGDSTYSDYSGLVSSSKVTGATHPISIGNLAAGTYLINVHNATTSGTATTTYKLTLSGSELCP